MTEAEDEFKRILKLRITATNMWRNELIRNRNALLTESKKNELTPFIDILDYWEDFGKYIEKSLEEE